MLGVCLVAQFINDSMNLETLIMEESESCVNLIKETERNLRDLYRRAESFGKRLNEGILMKNHWSGVVNEVGEAVIANHKVLICKLRLVQGYHGPELTEDDVATARNEMYESIALLEEHSDKQDKLNIKKLGLERDLTIAEDEIAQARKSIAELREQESLLASQHMEEITGLKQRVRLFQTQTNLVIA